jgi:membrane dipeptidase
MKFFILIAAVLGAFGFFLAPKYIDKSHNKLYPQAQALRDFIPPVLHSDLFVADFHADTLLWNRDLLKRGDYGHVDIPRLIAGNVALQGFSIVTKTPRKMLPDHNMGNTDNITLLAIAQRWPIETWGSLSERAYFQAENLRRVAAGSKGLFRIIHSQSELKDYIAARKLDSNMTAGFLSVEGSQALEGDLSRLDTLYGVGVRMIAPTHFFDTEYAGSAHGITHDGLTPEGIKWLAAVEAHNMIVDLAHASVQTIEDVLLRAKKPVVVSHTGVRGVCDSNRNLSDDQLTKIAEKGGLVGIGFFTDATCGTDVAAVIRSIAYAIKIMGPDHVALGSDFDGYVGTPIDASEMGAITQELMNAGISEPTIRKVMGENLRDFLLKNLPL